MRPGPARAPRATPGAARERRRSGPGCAGGSPRRGCGAGMRSHRLQGCDPLGERRVGVERAVEPAALLLPALTPLGLLVALERALDPHLCGGARRVVHDRLVVLELLERGDQPGWIARELDAGDVGEQLTPATHRELH